MIWGDVANDTFICEDKSYLQCNRTEMSHNIFTEQIMIFLDMHSQKKKIQIMRQ